MNLNFKWTIDNSSQYSCRGILYLNNIAIGYYFYNSIRSQKEMNKDDTWVGNIDLPSLRNKQIYNKNTEDIKRQIEALVSLWFEKILRNYPFTIRRSVV